MSNESEKERKERRKKEREELLKKNEKALFAPFFKSSGFWGFDNFELYVSIKAINANKLSLCRSRKCTFSATPLLKVNEAKPEERFNAIRICDAEFGEFYMSNGGGNPHAKCFLLKLPHGGMNSETVGIIGLKKRYIRAKESLSNKYGIDIMDNPSIRKLELAFTFTTDKKLPIEVRKLMMYILSKTSIITPETYANIGSSDEVHSLISKNSKKNKNVLYDKGAKAKKDRKIATYREDTFIYRFERTLTKMQLIKDEFIKTNMLNALTDEMFYDYINHMLDEAVDYYVNHILAESLKFFRQSLKAARLVSRQNYLAPLKDLITAPLATNFEEHVVDCETVVHANYNRIFPSDNVARAKRTIIGSSLQKYDRLRNMHVWEVERLLAWMRLSLTKSLGCPDCEAAGNLKSFHVAEGQYSNKNEYLNMLIKSKKKNLHLDYAGLVRDRIDHHWRNFELHTIIELEPLDKDKDVNSFIYKKWKSKK